MLCGLKTQGIAELLSCHFATECPKEKRLARRSTSVHVLSSVPMKGRRGLETHRLEVPSGLFNVTVALLNEASGKVFQKGDYIVELAKLKVVLERAYAWRRRHLNSLVEQGDALLARLGAKPNEQAALKAQIQEWMENSCGFLVRHSGETTAKRFRTVQSYERLPERARARLRRRRGFLSFFEF
jgi:hypothetical protein